MNLHSFSGIHPVVRWQVNIGVCITINHNIWYFWKLAMTVVIYTPNQHVYQRINHDIVRRWRKWSASRPGRFISATEHNGGDERSHARAVIKRVLNLKLRVFSDVTLCSCVSSRTAEEPRLLHCLTPKMKTLWCFETSENMYPTTHRGIPEELNFVVIISPTERCRLILRAIDTVSSILPHNSISTLAVLTAKSAAGSSEAPPWYRLSQFSWGRQEEITNSS
jgi:hypothetical protein